MLEAPYSSQHYSNLIWPLWPYPIQSPPKMSLFSGLISSWIFLSFRSCSCKDHLDFPLCYIKRNVCPKHFTGFKNNHQTNELCEFQRLSLGGLPSALRLLSILPLFLLSFLLSLKTNKHLLRSDFEIVPSTLTCLRLCSKHFHITKSILVNTSFTVSLQEKVKESFFCFASSRSFVVVENG